MFMANLNRLKRARILDINNEKYNNNGKQYIFNLDEAIANKGIKHYYDIEKVDGQEITTLKPNYRIFSNTNNETKIVDFDSFVFPQKKTSKRFKFKVYETSIP